MLAAFELVVEFVAGQLKAAVGGASATRLIPIGPTRFKFEGAPATVAAFELADGHVQKLTLETKSANLVFVPKKK